MGNWNISIRGVGCHHNAVGVPPEALTDAQKADADQMAKSFVKQLITSGHSITSCEITYGGAENLYPVGEPATGQFLPDPKPTV